MSGPQILVRTLSELTREDRFGNKWQYHSRSDHHSKVACWGVIFDLLKQSSCLRDHIRVGKVAFGVNHEMRDFRNDRKKNLDLVLCTPAGEIRRGRVDSIRTLIRQYSIQLTDEEKLTLQELPDLTIAPVGSVLLALEAKACMTAHQRALPRLYDELNSSHLTVHGASEHAIAVGYVMVNASTLYLSPDLNKANRASSPEWSQHNQPRDATLVVDKIKQMPRRSRSGEEGYDALAVSVVECKNDGSPISLFGGVPAPGEGEIFEYQSMISRITHLYASRFKDI